VRCSPLALAILFTSLLAAPAVAEDAGEPPKIVFDPGLQLGAWDVVELPASVSVYVSRRPVPLVGDSQAAKRALLPLTEAEEAREAALDAAPLWLDDVERALAAAAAGEPVDPKALTSALSRSAERSPDLRRALSPKKLARTVVEETAAPDGRSVEAVAQARSRALTPLELQRRAALAELQDVLTAGVGATSLSSVDTLVLAAALVERAEVEWLRAEQRYERELEKFDRGKSKQLPDPPRKDLARPAELLSDLLTLDPDFEGAEGAWYLLGWCWLDQPETHEELAHGVTAMTGLLDRFPDSELAPVGGLMALEALRGLGEPDQAARLGARLAERTDLGPYQPIAALITGEARFQRARDPEGYAEALAAFGQVLATDVASPDLRADAVRWAAFCIARLSDDDAPGAADRFFAGDHPDWERAARAGSGHLLMELARFSEAIAAETTFQERWPLDRDNPARQARVALLFQHQPEPDRVASIAASWQLVQEYDHDSAWAEANAADAEALAAGEQHVFEAFSRVALEEASDAVELGIPEVQSRAADRLGAWLARFPEREERHEMRWYQAWLLASAGRVDDAIAACDLLTGDGGPFASEAWALLEQLKKE